MYVLKKELVTVGILDRRDKIYKAIIILACIAALSILAVFDKASAIAPVIGVIIGLILKNNIVSEYFTGSTKKKEQGLYSDDDGL